MATHWIIPIQNSIKNLLPILKLIQKRLENVRDITADLVFYPSSCGALSAIFFFFNNAFSQHTLCIPVSKSKDDTINIHYEGLEACLCQAWQLCYNQPPLEACLKLNFDGT